MHDRIDDAFVFYLKIELFAALACKRLFGRFTLLYLSAHEFP